MKHKVKRPYIGKKIYEIVIKKKNKNKITKRSSSNWEQKNIRFIPILFKGKI